MRRPRGAAGDEHVRVLVRILDSLRVPDDVRGRAARWLSEPTQVAMETCDLLAGGGASRSPSRPPVSSLRLHRACVCGGHAGSGKCSSAVAGDTPAFWGAWGAEALQSWTWLLNCYPRCGECTTRSPCWAQGHSAALPGQQRACLSRTESDSSQASPQLSGDDVRALVAWRPGPEQRAFSSPLARTAARVREPRTAGASGSPGAGSPRFCAHTRGPTAVTAFSEVPSPIVRQPVGPSAPGAPVPKLLGLSRTTCTRRFPERSRCSSACSLCAHVHQQGQTDHTHHRRPETGRSPQTTLGNPWSHLLP